LSRKSDAMGGAGDEIAQHLTRVGCLADAADWFQLGLAKFTPGSRQFVAALAAGPQLEVYLLF
jgi:hypothetical protein